MKSTIATIQGVDVQLFVDEVTGGEIVRFIADADIDCDGSGGNPLHDPCFQPDTRYHHNGQALHAEKVPYVVVPPVVLAKTKGRVLGSVCYLRNLENKKTCVAVVGDSGPTKKIGELSPAAAELLGLSGNPNYGGTSDYIIEYQIEVGVSAVIDNVRYETQAA